MDDVLSATEAGTVSGPNKALILPFCADLGKICERNTLAKRCHSAIFKRNIMMAASTHQHAQAMTLGKLRCNRKTDASCRRCDDGDFALHPTGPNSGAHRSDARRYYPANHDLSGTRDSCVMGAKEANGNLLG